MRVLFFSIFYCVALGISGAFAGQVTSCGNPDEDNNCGPGCYYSTDLKKCEICGSGTYNDGTSASCKSCTKPNDAQWEESAGHTTNSCPWTLECEANQYWDGSRCVSCPRYNSSDGAILEGLGEEYPEPNSDICEPTVFTLTLEKNLTNFAESSKEAYVKYGVGFSKNKNGPWDKKGPGVKPDFNWWQDFVGYYTAKNGGIRRFNEEGYVERTGTTSTTFTEDTTLYGHWNKVLYTVEYYRDSAMENLYATRSCEMGNGGCEALKPGYGFVGSGNTIFDHWVCGAGCSGEFYPDDPEKNIIPEPSESYGLDNPIKLYAYFVKCPAGYYCLPGQGKREECPMGTTSAEGAAVAKSNCYMNRGPSGTKFCDDNGCFTFPGSGKIMYNPS